MILKELIRKIHKEKNFKKYQPIKLGLQQKVLSNNIL